MNRVMQYYLIDVVQSLIHQQEQKHWPRGDPGIMEAQVEDQAIPKSFITPSFSLQHHSLHSQLHCAVEACICNICFVFGLIVLLSAQHTRSTTQVIKRPSSNFTQSIFIYWQLQWHQVKYFTMTCDRFSQCRLITCTHYQWCTFIAMQD